MYLFDSPSIFVLHLYLHFIVLHLSVTEYLRQLVDGTIWKLRPFSFCIVWTTFIFTSKNLIPFEICFLFKSLCYNLKNGFVWLTCLGIFQVKKKIIMVNIHKKENHTLISSSLFFTLSSFVLYFPSSARSGFSSKTHKSLNWASFPHPKTYPKSQIITMEASWVKKSWLLLSQIKVNLIYLS